MSFDEDPQDDFDEFPLSYVIDNAILMHRDAHFSGNFDLMIDYYNQERRGVCNEFSLQRIEEMAEIEKQKGGNLSATLLSGAEMEKVAASRQSYQNLRDVYEVKKPISPIPALIADLILAEDEELEQAISQVVEQKSAIVPALISLLRNEDFYDPLNPGFGLAPQHAAKCLGLIGDKRAIISLFEAMKEGDFFSEDAILDALRSIGEPAKEFLLKVLHGTPITGDNELAAVALLEFKQDPQVSKACLEMLKTLDLKNNIPLATYLALACEHLQSPEERKLFLQIAEQPTTPKSLRQDILSIAKEWKSLFS